MGCKAVGQEDEPDGGAGKGGAPVMLLQILFGLVLLLLGFTAMFVVFCLSVAWSSYAPGTKFNSAMFILGISVAGVALNIAGFLVILFTVQP